MKEHKPGCRCAIHRKKSATVKDESTVAKQHEHCHIPHIHTDVCDCHGKELKRN